MTSGCFWFSFRCIFENMQNVYTKWKAFQYSEKNLIRFAHCKQLWSTKCRFFSAVCHGREKKIILLMSSFFVTESELKNAFSINFNYFEGEFADRYKVLMTIARKLLKRLVIKTFHPLQLNEAKNWNWSNFFLSI